MPPRHIAFHGRKGVGTTTVVSNISAALVEAGHRVILVGCDGEGDSTATLRRGKTGPTLLEAARWPQRPGLGEVAVTGFKGILCLEVGRPESVEDFRTALALAGTLLAAEGPAADFILYDVAGDPVREVAALLECAPIERFYAVSTADVAAVRVANELLRLVGREAGAGIVRVGGVIGNLLPGPYAEAVIDDFARESAVPVAGYVPRSLVVTRSAFFGETVIDAAPLAHQAYLYRKLARDVTDGRRAAVIPRPLGDEELRDWSLDWGDRLFDLGEGLVDGGAAI